MSFNNVRCRRSDAGPVPFVGVLVAVVVGVVVVSPVVVFLADMVLVGVVAEVDVGEDVLELGVVREGDGSEWVEVVGVDGLGLAHDLILVLDTSLLLLLSVGLVGTEVKTSNGWVDKEVGGPSHAAHSAQSVSSAHIDFRKLQSINYKLTFLSII